VEEEIPLHEEHLGQNLASTMEEDPAMNFSTTNDFTMATIDEDPVTHEEDDEADEQAHATPKSCRLTKDHLRDAQGFGRETTPPVGSQCDIILLILGDLQMLVNSSYRYEYFQRFTRRGKVTLLSNPP
jgi:hypothetical protein